MSEPTFYKWLTTDRITTYQQTVWPVRVGSWTPDKNPVLCQSGWHLATHGGIGEHCRIGAVLWEAEGRGEVAESDDKIAFTSVRLLRQVGTLDQQTAVRWAAECAKRVLKHYEVKYPDDKRPRDAINAALAWAKEPSEKNRAAAANAATYAAYAANATNDTHDPDGDEYIEGANAAAYAAYAAAAANAATYAAYAANATNATAKRKERVWQSDRLLVLIAGGPR
jgi:hypothetical protein